MTMTQMVSVSFIMSYAAIAGLSQGLSSYLMVVIALSSIHRLEVIGIGGQPSENQAN
ncbi:hypothetical protein QDQ51_06205 [Providencia rettgeri]|uniref:Uncharacterized protein n=1 Tax=Providencia rettgeri TaxID=587 RepID=A0AB35L982_PRORE|nr:hypothetical protein [Providencia rettgeri]MDH2305012.1 hypothetical protein [Providencia rettgeri]